MKPLYNLRFFFLLLPILYWGCKDDFCTRVDCAEDDVILFSILNIENGLDMVNEENLINPETDVKVFYKLDDKRVGVTVIDFPHLGKIRFTPHYTIESNRYFIEVLDQIDTLDLYFVLGQHPTDPHHCCPKPFTKIDSIYLNHIPFLPEFPSNANSQLLIYR